MMAPFVVTIRSRKFRTRPEPWIHRNYSIKENKLSNNKKNMFLKHVLFGTRVRELAREIQMSMLQQPVKIAWQSLSKFPGNDLHTRSHCLLGSNIIML